MLRFEENEALQPILFRKILQNNGCVPEKKGI